MKKLCSVVLATLLLFTISSTSWAGSHHHKHHKWTKEAKRSYYQMIRERIHRIRINSQFRALKHKYNRSHKDAQQLFLDYLGDKLPSSDEQLEALRQEYEQTIAEKDETIAALQQQLDQLAAQMSAECDARLGQAEEAWQANTQQQLNEQAAAYQTEITNLTAQKEAECTARIDQAYADWQAAAGDQCQEPGPLAQTDFIDTGSVYPYAIDTDASGHVFVLDQKYQTITEFDATGAQAGQWAPGTFILPSDIALDSQRNVYVLDKLAATPLQKFAPDGTPMPFDTGTTTINYPSGIYIDSNDMLYVTDYGGAMGGRILVFDSTGSLQLTFGEVNDLALDEYNDVVVDEANQRIHVITNNAAASFDMTGAYLGFWTGDFLRPLGIAAGPNGDIFIADTYNNEIDQYDSTGALKASFAQDTYQPFRIVTDASGKLYIADHGNRQIKVYE
ncbi:MAG: NHL repeat-containing protein [Desulfobacteraceae bacterium]